VTDEQNLDEMMRFASLNMNGTDFTNQDLRGARFASCNLNRADFTGAQLEGARFSSCNLNGAIFSPTVLSEATFASCNMHGVRYVKGAPSKEPDPPPNSEPTPSRAQGSARPSWWKR